MMLEINIANVWEDFHLLRPHFMWLMIPLVVLFIMGLIRIREQIRWKKYIAPEMRPYVIIILTFASLEQSSMAV